mmetsp:Transcript_27590/g.41746  ORF Transcript_27590/g.41746 Transcript_27590/m.41746 type:complete len:515 (+) Transcript_27590:165-1709(+)
MNDGFFDQPSPQHWRQNKSKSPKRNQNRSPRRNHQNRSPHRRHANQSPKRQSRSPKRQSKSPKRQHTPADMTVICHRVFLLDDVKHYQKQHCGEFSDDDTNHHHHHHLLPHPNLPVAPYEFVVESEKKNNSANATVAVIRAPQRQDEQHQEEEEPPSACSIMDTSIPNPHDPNVVHDKYWAQRRRLFSNFDMGIQLDAEGWYSVTPETIAMHVSKRLVETYSSDRKLIVMDAFCGCGGNAIAFGRNPNIALVVCIDVDRSKLKKAAYNACLYGIPKEKLIFVEGSSLHILEQCYRNGILHLPPPNHQQATVETEVCAGGFFVGGLGMLPQRIDAIFMDPPWGGVDYHSLGKNGYCLEKHMKIGGRKQLSFEIEKEDEPSNSLDNDFFDSFGTTTTTSHHKGNKSKHCNNFNQKYEHESDYWNGFDLLKIAASATPWVVYDLPRNTSKTSLAKGSLEAGYLGNLKLEEHYLNGRLKTITAYLGVDHTHILMTKQDEVANPTNATTMLPPNATSAN